MPLSLSIIITLIKDAYNDIQLKKQDKLINNTEYLCWDSVDFIVKKCENIIVGDFVTILENQVVPADMLLIECSNENKFVYTDLKRLTGSSSLKQVRLIENHQKIMIKTEDNFQVNLKLNCTLKISEPSYDYSHFYGRLKLFGDPGSLEVKPENLMFKGSTLVGVEKVFWKK